MSIDFARPLTNFILIAALGCLSGCGREEDRANMSSDGGRNETNANDGAAPRLNDASLSQLATGDAGLDGSAVTDASSNQLAVGDSGLDGSATMVGAQDSGLPEDPLQDGSTPDAGPLMTAHDSGQACADGACTDAGVVKDPSPVLDLCRGKTWAPAIDGFLPRLVADGHGGYAATWYALGAGPIQATFARLDSAADEVAGSRRTLSDGQTSTNSPRLVFNGTEYGLVFQRGVTDARIRFVRLTAAGTLIANSEVAFPSQHLQSYANLAWNPLQQEWGISWTENPSPAPPQGMFQRVSAAGVVLGVPTPLITSEGVHAGGHSGGTPLIWSGSEFILLHTGSSSLRLTRFDPTTGAVSLSHEVMTPPSLPYPSSIAKGATGYGIAWQQQKADNTGAASHFARLSSTFQLVSGSTITLSSASAFSQHAGVVWAGNHYQVVWSEGPSPISQRLWSESVADTGTRSGRVELRCQQPDDTDTSPAIMFDGARSIATFTRNNSEGRLWFIP